LPRLDILLAHNLGISRAAVTRLLRAGRVRDAEGTAQLDGRASVAAQRLPWTLELDGSPVTLRTRMDLLQHKPLGVVTALRDAVHPTAYALLADAPLRTELRAVGRLDIDSTGLLLWTTDGALLHRLTHPRRAVPRTYHVALGGPWTPVPPGFALDDGHVPTILELDARDAEQMHPGLVFPSNARRFATITVTSGRFHEVRRIFAELDTLVLGLCRVRYGEALLPVDLPAGAWVPLEDLASAEP
jgi:16S rRNA pseudouridine516 synthase